MNTTFELAGVCLLSLMLAACSTAPPSNDVLENARARVAEVDGDPMAEQVAGAELEQAKRDLSQAEAALSERHSAIMVQHYAYMATRHADIARERIAEARANEGIESSEAERNQIVLEARTREAERAKAQAQIQAFSARNARAEADAKALEAEKARALAEASKRELELKAKEAAQARAQTGRALAEARVLQDELESLKAQQTDRGLVLTLNGGVLFDTDQATLKPGAEVTLDRLAAFLAEHPERNLMVEGHTDSTGDKAYNMALSERRADAVRDALIARNVQPVRIEAVGLGENYPLATNDSSAGRQLNRRVEIVISDEKGLFLDSAERSVSIY